MRIYCVYTKSEKLIRDLFLPLKIAPFDCPLTFSSQTTPMSTARESDKQSVFSRGSEVNSMVPFVRFASVDELFTHPS